MSAHMIGSYCSVRITAPHPVVVAPQVVEVPFSIWNLCTQNLLGDVVAQVVADSLLPEHAVVGIILANVAYSFDIQTLAWVSQIF